MHCLICIDSIQITVHSEAKVKQLSKELILSSQKTIGLNIVLIFPQ